MKKREPSPIEVEVTAWLEKAGVKYECHGGHATKLGDWPCDAWTWIFSRGLKGTTEQRRIEDRHYTGVGQRQLTPLGKRYMSSIGKGGPIYISNARRRIIAEHSRAVAPHAASILYCTPPASSIACSGTPRAPSATSMIGAGSEAVTPTASRT